MKISDCNRILLLKDRLSSAVEQLFDPNPFWAPDWSTQECERMAQDLVNELKAAFVTYSEEWEQDEERLERED